MLKPFLTSAAVLGALAVSIPAQSQGYRQGYQGYGQPRGSYTQSCRDVQVSGDRLEAQCRRTDGSWQRTELNLGNGDGGDIGNSNGRLVCGGGYGSSQRANPERDYNRPVDRPYNGYSGQYNGGPNVPYNGPGDRGPNQYYGR
jgi:hypothetical protein